MRAALLALLLAMPALALEPEAAVEQARALNAEAQSEFDLAHYKNALELFERVYKLRPVPSILFNIAQCHRKMGELKDAANTYRSFLVHAEPGTPETLKGKELLAQVEEAIRQQESAARAPPTEAMPSAFSAKDKPPPPVVLAAAAPSPPAPPPPRSHTASWALGGTGAALLVAGAVFGAKSSSAGSELTSGPHSRDQIESLSSTKTSNAKLADVLFAGTLVLGAVAVIAW